MVPVIDLEALQSKLDGGHGSTVMMRGDTPANSGHDGLGRARLWLHNDLADLAGAD